MFRLYNSTQGQLREDYNQFNKMNLCKIIKTIIITNLYGVDIFGDLNVFLILIY